MNPHPIDYQGKQYKTKFAKKRNSMFFFQSELLFFSPRHLGIWEHYPNLRCWRVGFTCTHRPMGCHLVPVASCGAVSCWSLYVRCVLTKPVDAKRVPPTMITGQAPNAFCLLPSKPLPVLHLLCFPYPLWGVWKRLEQASCGERDSFFQPIRVGYSLFPTSCWTWHCGMGCCSKSCRFSHIHLRK